MPQITNRTLVSWASAVLQTPIRKLNEAFQSHFYCQLFDACHPGAVPMHKVRWPARSEPEHTENLRVLQYTFAKLGLDKRVDIQELAAAKMAACLPLLQWMHGHWIDNHGPDSPYAATDRRARCKGLRGAKAGRRRRPPRALRKRGRSDAMQQQSLSEPAGTTRSGPATASLGRSSIRSRLSAPVTTASRRTQQPQTFAKAPSAPPPQTTQSAQTAQASGQTARRQQAKPLPIDREAFSAALFQFHPIVRCRSMPSLCIAED